MRNIRLMWVAALVLVVAACGGGGGGSDDNDSSPNSNSGSSNNHAPVADAGKQQNVATGSMVRLDGSASSDADDDKLTYHWRFNSRPAGSNAGLQDADTAAPLFTPDVAGKYVARLVVGDGSAFSDPDTVTIVASSNNSAPMADAGDDQSVTTGSKVTLDGSGSTDADDDTLVYHWKFVAKPGGSNAQLGQPNSISPSFSADVAGDYTVQLVVGDGKQLSDPSRVTVHAATNAAPVAHAGKDRGVSIGDTVTLDGSDSSDANGDDLSYSWRLISVPKGSAASLRDANTAKPSFVADAVGKYVAQVTVSDDNDGHNSDGVMITAGPTLKLSADLANDGSYENSDLPYDQTYGQTVVKAPTTQNPNDQGFVLGRFKATAVGGDITLNLSFNIKRLNDSTGAYALAFDGFQGYGEPNTKQVVIPQGKTVAFTVNAGIPMQSKARLTYGFTAVNTGDSFKASYTVESNDN